MRKIIVNTSAAPIPLGPYSQAVQAGDFLFLSGQIGITVPEGTLVKDDIRQEATQVMENLKAVLDAAGMDFSNVVKTTICLLDMGQFSTVNEIYGSYFNADFPARETVAVAALPKGARVEISMIASR
jgi:2-iminobutanoate/2-iminopropanoate deaminase